MTRRPIGSGVRAAISGGPGRPRSSVLLAMAVVAAAVLAFSGGWPGDLVLDGPGIAAYVRMAVEHVRADGSVPYWMPELWSGAPVWALAPSVPITALVPPALWLGPESAVKLVTLGIQVAAGCGALVLARSLWGGTGVPLLAGLLYGLHPMVIAHGALFGQENSAAVIAITPWLAWTVRRALQPGGGMRHSVLAGALGALAVLHQAEHAYGLAILCVLQFALELARAARTGSGRVALVAKRAAVSVGVATGLIAFWLLPLAALGDWFIFTPPEMARAGLAGSPLVGDALALVRRTGSVAGAYGFNRPFFRGTFYLSWVCLIPAFGTALALSRRDEDGHLSTIGVAGCLCLWLSTAGARIPEAGSMAIQHVVLLFGLAVVTGVVVAKALGHVATPRAAVAGGVAIGAVLFVAPFVHAFTVLRRVVPLLESQRFPRFYAIAVLGVALGAAYSVVLAARWAAGRRWATVGTLAAALLVAFAVDIVPYRSFYRVRLPADDAAYAAAAETLATGPEGSRVATANYHDPRPVDALVAAGFELSVGWPHPVAGRDVWRVTAEALEAPRPYRERALGLSGTAFVTEELFSEPGTGAEEVRTVRIEPNPRVLPRVRAYRDVVVVRDEALAPELATLLASRSVGTVTGGAPAAQALGPVAPTVLEGSDLCGRAPPVAPPLANDVAVACSLHPWIGVRGRSFRVQLDEEPGGYFVASAPGLRAVGVRLDGPPGAAELVLHEVAADGSPGPVVRRSRSFAGDLDDPGLAAFRFEPIDDSGGKRYSFTLSCRRCPPDRIPEMWATHDSRTGGSLHSAGAPDGDAAAAFSLSYAGGMEGRSSSTAVTGRRPAEGRWRLDVTGPEPALVVVADTYFPGWHAEVDGEPAPVLRADGAFVGVMVPSGTHRVDLVYRAPPAVFVGRAVTGGTVIVLVVGAGRPWWRRRGRRPVALTTAPDPVPA